METVLARTFYMASFDLPSFSVFVGNWYVQHAGAEELGHTSLRYVVHFVLEDIKLPKDIMLSYDGASQLRNSYNLFSKQKT